MISAAGVLAAVFIPGSAGAATAPDAFHPGAASLAGLTRYWSAVPEYQSAPALAAGRLTDPQGQAMAGATVVVTPVPVSPKPGQRLMALARTTTDAAGRYTLRLPAAQRQQLGSPDKRDLDLHVWAYYPDAVASWFVAVPPGTTKVPAANLVFRELPGSTSPAAPTPPGPPSTCVLKSQTQIPDIRMSVGYESTLTAARIKYITYHYTAAASETTGVGLSYSGKYAGFSVDGTYENSSGYAADFTLTGRKSDYFNVESVWNDNDWLCVASISKPAFNAWTVSFKSAGTADGTSGAPVVAAGKCLPAAANEPNHYTSETQETFSAGASIAGMIGINLSAQSGWSTSSELTYDLAEKGAICGVHNYPNTPDPSAGALQVH